MAEVNADAEEPLAAAGSTVPAATHSRILETVVEIRGLMLLGVHGVLDEERERPQPFEIDLDLVVERGHGRRATSIDDLSTTADYAVAVERVRSVVENESFELLESLASRVAEVLVEDPKVSSASVVVRKLRPPLPAHVTSAGVRVRVTR